MTGKATAARGNLPAELTSFIGRRRQLQDVKSALTGARLVTLVGPGGVGKTRLALRSAIDLSRGIADGAWLVELEGVRDLVTQSGHDLAGPPEMSRADGPSPGSSTTSPPSGFCSSSTTANT